MKSYRNVSVCVKTHIGLRRKNNEDNYLVVTEGRNVHNYGMLFAVADGKSIHGLNSFSRVTFSCFAVTEYTTC